MLCIKQKLMCSYHCIVVIWQRKIKMHFIFLFCLPIFAYYSLKQSAFVWLRSTPHLDLSSLIGQSLMQSLVLWRVCQTSHQAGIMQIYFIVLCLSLGRNTCTINEAFQAVWEHHGTLNVQLTVIFFSSNLFLILQSPAAETYLLIHQAQ